MLGRFLVGSDDVEWDRQLWHRGSADIEVLECNERTMPRYGKTNLSLERIAAVAKVVVVVAVAANDAADGIAAAVVVAHMQSSLPAEVLRVVHKYSYCFAAPKNWKDTCCINWDHRIFGICCHSSDHDQTFVERMK